MPRSSERSERRKVTPEPEPAPSLDVPLPQGNAALLTPERYVRLALVLRRKYDAWPLPDAEEEIETQIADARQETFLGLAENYDVVRNSDSFVNKVGCRRMADERRQNQAQRAGRARLQRHLLHTGEAVRQIDHDTEETWAEPIAPKADPLAYISLMRFLDSLSAKERGVFVDYVYNGDTLAEVGERYNIDPSTVDRWVHKIARRGRAKTWYPSNADFVSLRTGLALRTQAPKRRPSPLASWLFDFVDVILVGAA